MAQKMGKIDPLEILLIDMNLCKQKPSTTPKGKDDHTVKAIL